MKNNDANRRVRFQAKAYLVLVIVLVVATADQTRRLLHARSTLEKLSAKRAAVAKQAIEENRNQESLREQTQILSAYAEKLPFVDGYVWLSRFLRETAPGLQLAVNPPDMTGPQILMLNDYCTGTFRIRGSGGKEDLLHLLRQIEGNLPFARLQDIQFNFTDPNRSHVQFTFALMLVMRLHDAPSDSTMQAVALRTLGVE